MVWKSKKGFKWMLLSFVIITFLSACNSEEEVEEPEVIREGPPPLENPQYVDLGTFIVNMPGDKYFLKSSIQIAFNDCLLYTSPSPRDLSTCRMPSSA